MYPLDLNNIPEGVWIRREGETIILGSARPPLSFANLFTLAMGLGLLILVILPLIPPFNWIKLFIGIVCLVIGGFILLAELGNIEFRLHANKGIFSRALET